MGTPILITTVSSDVVVKDLGIEIIHPAVAQDIATTYGYTRDEIRNSSDLQAELDGGSITATFDAASVANLLDDVAPVSIAQNAAILANTSPAYVGSISLTTVSINANYTITIAGTGFTPNTVFDLGSAITINSTVFDSSTQVTLAISTDNSTGTYAVLATNNGVPSSGTTTIIVEAQSVTIIPGVTVPWTDVTAGVTVGVGTLSSPGVEAWSQQAIFASIPAAQGGYVEFTYIGAASGTAMMLGLASDPFGNAGFTALNYAVYIQSNGLHSVRESFVSRGIFGGFVPGDTFRITRTGTTISYAINGTTYYTSDVASSVELFFDCSLYMGADFEDIRIVY